MPGFDGTGPMGMGPMTGGGRGFCALPMGSRPAMAMPGYGAGMPWPGAMGYPYQPPMYPMGYGYGGYGVGMMGWPRMGMGMGMGRGRGLGMGFGRGMGFGMARPWGRGRGWW